jgi:hypothetical protein
MPEVVTKYPDVLIKELKDAGGKCGENIKPTILTSCPADRFCLLPTGEICVYDLQSIKTMTQISPSDWTEVITGIPGMFSLSTLLVLIFIFGIGLVIGFKLNKSKNSS